MSVRFKVKGRGKVRIQDKRQGQRRRAKKKFSSKGKRQDKRQGQRKRAKGNGKGKGKEPRQMARAKVGA